MSEEARNQLQDTIAQFLATGPDYPDPELLAGLVLSDPSLVMEALDATRETRDAYKKRIHPNVPSTVKEYQERFVTDWVPVNGGSDE